jgi:hypothetical protein
MLSALAVPACGTREQVVSTTEAEQKLRAQARRDQMPVSHVRCVRAKHLPDSFDCFVEGQDDLHLAYRVTVQPNGKLIVRPPQ